MSTATTTHDDDGLIEIRSIAQLDAIRHDLDGDGAADDARNDAAAYAAAFPNAATGMGCPTAGCTGYELAATTWTSELPGQLRFGWAPIGYYRSRSSNAAFNATVDDGGYTISNRLVSRSNANYVGLFAFSDGIIRRVALLNVNVFGKANVGSLVGINHGTIADSYVTGSVTGSGDDVGVLVGDNSGDGVITNSYADIPVNGDQDVGGLVGRNDATITDSHATGDVTSNGGSYDNVDGLVGLNYGGVVARCYATGTSIVCRECQSRRPGRTLMTTAVASSPVTLPAPPPVALEPVGWLVGTKMAASSEVMPMPTCPAAHLPREPSAWLVITPVLSPPVTPPVS